MTAEFHTVSDCSVLDPHGRVVGVMCDHWTAHELIDMSERDKTWIDPEEVAQERQELEDGAEERVEIEEKKCQDLQEQLDDVKEKDYQFRQWASARISELEELFGEQGKETGRATLE